MHSIITKVFGIICFLFASGGSLVADTAQYANSYPAAVAEYKAFLGKEPTKETLIALLESKVESKNEALVALAMKVAVLSNYVSDEELTAFAKLHTKSGMVSYNYAYTVLTSPARLATLAESAKQVLIDSLGSSSDPLYLLLTARLLLEKGHKEGLKIFYIKNAWAPASGKAIARTRESVISLAKNFQGTEFNGSPFDLASLHDVLATQAP